MRFKPPKHSAAFFALVLLIISVVVIVSPVHAGTNILFVQMKRAGTGGATTLTLQSMSVQTGDVMVVIIFLYVGGSFNSFAVSDTLSTAYAQKVASIPGGSGGVETYIWAGSLLSTAADLITVSTGGSTLNYAVAALEYRNVNGFGAVGNSRNDAQTSQTYTSPVTLSGASGDGSAVVEADYYNLGTGVTFNQAQTVRSPFNSGNCPAAVDSGATITPGCTIDDWPEAASSFTLSQTWSSTGGSSACSPSVPCLDSHVALELTGTSKGTISSVQQCYGNCGTPPVTLANTNSTKTVNFNTSITLFYQFQPTITGFMVNVTTNLAATLSNGFRSPWLAFYTAQCQVGVTPGTTACPFVQNLGSNTAATSKGAAFIAGGAQYPVTAGEWIAVAVSAQISGMALNDTNTPVQMLQTSGIIPGAITASSIFSGASKIGLWAWIQGNVVGSLPPPLPTQSTCFGLDCILANVVNSFCQNVTTACQTSSSMFWAVILTILSIGVTAYFLNQTLPGLNLGRLGLGELGVLIFVMWIAIFTSFNLMSLYVLAIVFSIVAILMGKRVQGMI